MYSCLHQLYCSNSISLHNPSLLLTFSLLFFFPYIVFLFYSSFLFPLPFYFVTIRMLEEIFPIVYCLGISANALRMLQNQSSSTTAFSGELIKRLPFIKSCWRQLNKLSNPNPVTFLQSQ